MNAPGLRCMSAALAYDRVRYRRARLSDIVALALCVALLGLFVWTLSAPEPEATRIIARAVAR